MNKNGLTSQEVLNSRAAYGTNQIPDTEPTTFWAEFKESFSDPMIRILLAIAGLMLGLWGASFIFPQAGIEQTIYEPIGTMVAVLLVATISAKTAVSSDGKYRDLKARTEKDQAKVIRDGSTQSIDFDDVVVGDIIHLQSGDKIPADGTLIEGSLRVDNSALNGEAEECHKEANPDGVVPNEITGDTFVDKSSLFRGAIVYDGDGLMVVQKVGLKTMMGKMAEEMSGDEPDSPLKVKLSKLANQISIFGYVSAALIVLLYLITGIINAGGPSDFLALGWQHVLNTVIKAADLAILIVVCAVPEGLPLMISLVLMQNTSKLLDHNVLVRKAQGIETAGAVNIQFSDKTGTITKGNLEVVELFDGKGGNTGISDKLINCIARNTQSTFDRKGNVIGGNATEHALMKYIGQDHFHGCSAGVVAMQGFNSANKFSQAKLSDGTLVYKGAPEKILAKCTKYMDVNGNIADIDMDALNTKIEEMANKAMRMLAFAYCEADLEENVIHENLTLIAVAAIRDDVRPEAKTAIEAMQKAGIQVVMITGDRLETARAIAKDAGLVRSDKDKVLSSAELATMSDDDIKKILKDIRVIARALPTDKSRMVRISQEMGLVCGMTGDGVNDSPALKRADVGFAMGSGTEAAKEAGDLIILDDNFNSIKDAVWFGRTIFHNILKFVKFQLTINVAAVGVTLLAPLFGCEPPLTVVHLLFVNLVMDGLGSIMLGSEPALPKYMTEKPRNREDSIIDKSMIGSVIIPAFWIIALGFVFLKVPFFTTRFDSVLQMNTAFFAFFIWAALWNGFNVRSDRFAIFSRLSENPGFLKVLAIIALVQAAIINIGEFNNPVCQTIAKMFSCMPFGIAEWGIVAVLSFTIIPVASLAKLALTRK